MLIFNRRFFFFTLVLFIIEVLIALFMHDPIIRPYGGDYLVVILVHCAVRTFIKASPLKVAMGVLLFSYCIEALQYYNFVDRLGLSDNKIARTVIGYGFDWLDILSYTLGIVTVLILESFFRRRNLKEFGT
jgi:hypothetical protein